MIPRKNERGQKLAAIKVSLMKALEAGPLGKGEALRRVPELTGPHLYAIERAGYVRIRMLDDGEILEVTPDGLALAGLERPNPQAFGRHVSMFTPLDPARDLPKPTLRPGAMDAHRLPSLAFGKRVDRRGNPYPQ